MGLDTVLLPAGLPFHHKPAPGHLYILSHLGLIGLLYKLGFLEATRINAPDGRQQGKKRSPRHLTRVHARNIWGYLSEGRLCSRRK